MKFSPVSIVIPTWNEQDNVRLLVERIDAAMKKSGITYEIIFVDDRSEDETQEILEDLKRHYPLTVYIKKAQQGKAQSLLEGFGYAKYPLIAMIDADLQYPPEAISEMVRMIAADKTDIVVANRIERQTSFLRTFLSKSFIYFFVRFLHKMEVDSQAGLKVFKKEILDRLELNPSPWAFDLEFLVKARNAGYRIGSTDIIFSSRHAGEEKISLVKASSELALSAIRLKLKKLPVAIFNFATLKTKGLGFHYKGVEFVHHTKLHHSETALTRFGGRQISFIFGSIAVLGLMILINWHATIVIVLSSLTLIYFIDLIFNLFLVRQSFKYNPEIKISKKELDSVSDWPRYTVFCPLYKEWQVISQFAEAMGQLDYPKNKLQIMLLLEEDDEQTIEEARRLELPDYFEIVVVPHSLPKTKPKALNYGLSKATGEFIVVYDAEDVPEPEQLKKAVLAFRKATANTICVQAKLNFYNPRQNVLTRVFTAEYSLWFDLILPGIQAIKGPIPLGGTSNHFRKKDVVHLKGWDAFNVTEDCDLGIRLAKQGYVTAIIESTTYEEANSKFWNWYSQRSRWIKGYIQTYLVHMRNPGEFLENAKYYHLVAFQFIVGGKILALFINPFMWCITIIYFAFRPVAGEFIESFFPTYILYIGVFSFLFGNFLYLYYYMIGCAKRGYFDLIKYVYLVPFYWLMMSFAAWRAVYEMIVKPHYWAKTLHGLHLKETDQAAPFRIKTPLEGPIE